MPARSASPPPETGITTSAGPILVESDAQHIVIEWRAPAYDVREDIAAGQAVHRIVMPDCPPAGQPGDPQLPVCTTLLGIPPDAALSLQILAEEIILLPGVFLLPPHPEQVVKEDLPLGTPWAIPTVETRWSEGAVYSSAAPFPSEAAALGEPAFLRHQRIVPLSFFPLQYRPQSGELLYHPRLRIQITLDGAAEPAGTVAEPAEFERLLSRELLNYAQARQWRRTSRAQLDIPPAPPDPGWRILVDQEGIYRLTYERLQQAGLPVDTLDPRTLRLYRYGQEVAIQVIGQEDGQLDPGDELLFYGQPLPGNLYTDGEVYWLTYGGPSGRRMAQRDGTPHGVAPVPASFAVDEHLETNLLYRSQMPWRPDHDHWFWNYTFPEANVRRQTYNFPGHALAGEPYTATLRIYLYSWTQMPVNPDHHILIYMNDVLLDELWWDGQVELTPTLAFPSTLLQPGGNSVRIECPGDTGAAAELIMYDWLELGQRRLYAAEGGRLPWTGEPGNWEYHLSSFSAPEILLFDTTDPDDPVEIISGTVVPISASYTLHFEDTVTGTTNYLAVGAGQVLEPGSILAATPPDLRDPGNGADYLILTHGDFYTQALSLAAFRAGQGLRTMVVDVESIYDLFAYGRHIPEAIHDFLAYAYENWAAPAPSYVVLLGDGHFDPKDYMGYGTGEFVLPYLDWVDPWAGQTAADNRYVCLSGADQLPDMHLGRLPANSPAQAQVMVNKIVHYESAPPAGLWRQQALFVADNADQAGDFPGFSDGLIAGFYPPPYQAERVYLGITHPYENPSVIAHNAIITAVNGARLLVNYIGHGGTSIWASEGLLNSSTLNNLSNDPYLPVALAMTCNEGYYIYPHDNPLYFAVGESFLRAEGKGWVASWSPTGNGVATGHDYLSRGFFQAVFLDDESRLGPATLAGKLRLYASSSWLDLLDTYELFGDPALAMPLLTTDLSVAKSAQPETPLHPGDPLTFTLRLSNAGPATAHHVVLSDTLSPWLISPTVTVEGITLTVRPGEPYAWDVEDMTGGQVGTLTIAVSVSPTAPLGFLTNQALVETSAQETDLSNNVDQVTLLIAAGAPAHITATVFPPSLPADNASLALIQAMVTDAAHHPVADGTVVLFATDAGTFFAGGTTYSGTTHLGVTEALLRASDQVTTATVSIAAGAAWTQLSVPFLPLDPYTITVAAEPSTIPVTGTAYVTATVIDLLGHSVADGTPVTFTTTLGSITPTLAATVGGRVTATLQGDGREGLATVVASSGAAAGATIVRVGAGATLTLYLEITPTVLPADGQSQATVTALLCRAGCEPVTGTHWVSFTTTLGTIPAGAWAVSGTAVVSLTSGTVPGTALVVAASEGASDWSTVQFLPGAPASLTLTAVPQVIPVDGHHSLLLAAVRDPGGNPVADGTAVDFSTSSGTVTPTAGATHGGQAYAVLTSGAQAGTASVEALSGPAGDSTTVRFLALSPATLTLAITPTVLVADGVSTTTAVVWVGDHLGNPVEDGTAVSWLTNRGTITPELTLTQGGWSTATLRSSTQLGTALVQALVGELQAQQAVSFVPGPAATVLVTADPPQLLANGASTATVNAYLWDALGHTVADGTPVSLSASLGTIAPRDTWTAGGQVTATLRSALTLGTSAVRATSGAAQGTAAVPFVPGPPYRVTVRAEPPALIADGVSTATVRAYLEDIYGHPVAAGTVVTFSTSLGTITPTVTPTQNGWAETVLRSSTQVGWAVVRAASGAAWGETRVAFRLYAVYLPLVLRGRP